MEFNYDVFLSYRHRPLDGVITKKVFNALESYRLPKALRDRGCPGIRRVFRDTEELSVSKILTETIDDALRSTNCLIVICSPDAAQSPWVDREVSMFIRMGRAEHVYPLLIKGEPEEAFPPSLQLIPDVADRVMDVRSPGDDPKKIMAQAETKLLRVIADVAGCDRDELLRLHTLRRNRRSAARAVGAAGTFLAIAGISLGLMAAAARYRDTARQREAASLRILNELTYSLPDDLTNVPGAYGRIAGILRRNTEDLNAILRLSQNKEAAEFEAAANYEKLADAGTVLGAYEDALSDEETAIGVFETLLDADYPGSQAALASAYNNRGTICRAAGRYPEAADDFARAIELMEGTEDPEPLTLANMYINAAVLAMDTGNNAASGDLFASGLALLDRAGESADALMAAAQANYNYGILLYRLGDYAGAEARLSQACDQYVRISETNDTLQNRNAHLRAASVLAASLVNQGRYSEADFYYAQAVGEARVLAEDRENMDNQQSLADLTLNWGVSFNIRGDYARADEYYRAAAEVYRTIMERTGSATAAATYAKALINTGENAYKAGAYDESRSFFAEGLEVYGSVCESLGAADVSEYRAWVSYDLLINHKDLMGSLNAALDAVDRQPDSILANLILAYSCLYNGYDETADDLFSAIAALGGGMAENIREDLASQQRGGLDSDHIPAVLKMLEAYQ